MTSTLPAVSTARTLMLCAPAARRRSCAASCRQRRRRCRRCTGTSPSHPRELNVERRRRVVRRRRVDRPTVNAVSGAVRSTVKLRTAGVASMLPAGVDRPHADVVRPGREYGGGVRRRCRPRRRRCRRCAGTSPSHRRRVERERRRRVVSRRRIHRPTRERRIRRRQIDGEVPHRRRRVDVARRCRPHSTRMLCAPSPSAAVTVCGELQAAKAPLSTLHWNVAVASVGELNVKLGVESFVGVGSTGPPVMAVFGGVRSMVKLRRAGVGSKFSPIVLGLDVERVRPGAQRRARERAHARDRVAAVDRAEELAAGLVGGEHERRGRVVRRRRVRRTAGDGGVGGLVRPRTPRCRRSRLGAGRSLAGRPRGRPRCSRDRWPG